MDMRDRLVELLKEILPTRGTAGGIPIIQKWDYKAVADKLIENGVLFPQCKVGDTIYFVCGYNMSDYTVKSIEYDNIFWQFDCENDMYAVEHRRFSFFDERIGKTVFLTREEAERALKFWRNKNDL